MAKNSYNNWQAFPLADQLGNLGDEALINEALQSGSKAATVGDDTAQRATMVTLPAAQPLPSGPVEQVKPIPIPNAQPGEGKQTQPLTLKAGEGNRVNPQGLFSYLQNKFADSGLVGYVPPDGARWGIKTGSASEWAAFGLAVAKQESDLNPRSYNASDPGGSVGLFQFGQGQKLFTKGGDQFNPQESADAFVRSVQHYVGNKGSVANMGATFGSIRRPNEAGQYIPYAQKLASGSVDTNYIPQMLAATTLPPLPSDLAAGREPLMENAPSKKEPAKEPGKEPAQTPRLAAPPPVGQTPLLSVSEMVPEPVPLTQAQQIAANRARLRLPKVI